MIIINQIKYKGENKTMEKIRKLSTKKSLMRNSKKINCNVSIASNEIMLNRIFNGNRFEFPFSNYLN